MNNQITREHTSAIFLTPDAFSRRVARLRAHSCIHKHNAENCATRSNSNTSACLLPALVSLQAHTPTRAWRRSPRSNGEVSNSFPQLSGSPLFPGSKLLPMVLHRSIGSLSSTIAGRQQPKNCIAQRHPSSIKFTGFKIPICFAGFITQLTDLLIAACSVVRNLQGHFNNEVLGNRASRIKFKNGAKHRE